MRARESAGRMSFSSSHAYAAPRASRETHLSLSLLPRKMHLSCAASPRLHSAVSGAPRRRSRARRDESTVSRPLTAAHVGPFARERKRERARCHETLARWSPAVKAAVKFRRLIAREGQQKKRGDKRTCLAKVPRFFTDLRLGRDRRRKRSHATRCHTGLGDDWPSTIDQPPLTCRKRSVSSHSKTSFVEDCSNNRARTNQRASERH